MATVKFNRLLFPLLFFFTCQSVYSQKSSRHFIDSVLTTKDTTFKLFEKAVYVVNGIPYDSLALDSTLTRFEIKDLLDVIYWNGKKYGHYPFYGDAVIIVFAHPQKTKYKHNTLKSAIKLFSDNSNPPILTINNNIIDKTISKDSLKKIKLEDILYLDIITLEKEPRVRIWTTE